MTKVLLVEDDAWLAELETRVLEKEGLEVKAVSHGFDAIDCIDTFMPDVIVLDVLLGGTTAFALLNELRSYQDTVNIPIILCTNLAEHVANKGLEAYGVRRVVDKTTMHPTDLVVAIRAVLNEGIEA